MLNQALWLVKNGIDADLAFALSPSEAFAWGAIFRKMETGETYDFESGEWVSLR